MPKKPVIRKSNFKIQDNAPLPPPASGRPNNYRPEFCQQAIELGKLGKSPAQIASEFGVDRATFFFWRQEHPEFDAAMTQAKTHEQRWWEDTAQNALHADRFQAAVWSKSMSARFREDYTERKETTLAGPDGGPVQTATTVTQKIDYASMTPEEREAIKAVILRTKGETSA